MKRSNLEATFLSSQIFPLNFLLVTEASAVARDDAHWGVSRNNIFFNLSRILWKKKPILNSFSAQKVANHQILLFLFSPFTSQLISLCLWNCFVQKIGSTNCRKAFHKNIQTFPLSFKWTFRNSGSDYFAQLVGTKSNKNQFQKTLIDNYFCSFSSFATVPHEMMYGLYTITKICSHTIW